VIERLGDKGEPGKPKGIAARFRNIVGAIVRGQLAYWITTINWKTVPKATKDVLWAKVKEKFFIRKCDAPGFLINLNSGQIVNRGQT
jgi:hypothetical protein